LGTLLSFQHIFIILFILFLNWILATARWQLILSIQNFQLSFLQILRYNFIGAFFNYVIPGGVGGDFVKSFYIARENPNARLKSIITIAMDRLLGLFSMVLMALIVMLWNLNKVLAQPQLKYIFTALVLVFAGFMLAWSFVFSRRLYRGGLIQKICSRLPHGDKPLKLYQAFAEYQDHKLAFFKAIGLSLASQGIAILSFIYTGWALGFSVDMYTYFFVVPIGFMVTAIPVSPAGVGVGQAGYYFLFNVATNSDTQLGPLLITANQIFNFAFGLIGAFIYITSKKSEHLP
jgi:uncharacterized protein (TIRG00374 family)